MQSRYSAVTCMNSDCLMMFDCGAGGLRLPVQDAYRREWQARDRLPHMTSLHGKETLLPVTDLTVMSIASGKKRCPSGQKQRASFIVNLVEREIRHREQREALREAAGSWKNDDYPELTEGADEWVREMRHDRRNDLRGSSNTGRPNR